MQVLLLDAMGSYLQKTWLAAAEAPTSLSSISASY